ncbi:hypothetical protein [Arthrobacter sp. NA-172]|uniref:hypothetical protein n=1 Tax=Arthrobacter sp. NA-172 TaxID=3367524 RepID=UPI003754B628
MDGSRRSWQARSLNSSPISRALAATVELTATAVELYTLVPSAFTAVRSARAKEAKSGGNAELAKQISQLPKPSTPAWAVNMLVRHGAKEFAVVLELGASLGKAQEEQDPSRLRSLGQQRPRVLAAAVERARAIAEGLGVKVSGAAAVEIEATLRAAMTDPGAAVALRSGMLVRTLSTNGLEAVDLLGAVALPDFATIAAAPPAGEVPDDGGRQRAGADSKREREKAKVALAEAEHNAVKADLELARAEREKSEAVDRGERLAVEVKATKDKLVALQQELAATEWTITRAERDRKVADRAASRERLAVEVARRRLPDP